MIYALCLRSDPFGKTVLTPLSAKIYLPYLFLISGKK